MDIERLCFSLMDEENDNLLVEFIYNLEMVLRMKDVGNECFK